VFQFSPLAPAKVHIRSGTPPPDETSAGIVSEGLDMADAGARVLRGLLDVFVLASLEQAPKHGYALLREMADVFGTEPNRNRLYPLLGRMVRDGLIREASEGGSTRTLYALTDAGREALATYRRLPAPFRDRLARIWGVAPATVAASPAPVPVVVTARDAPAPHEGAPYPCAQARVAVQKSPRTGELEVRLAGCPMGAYDYCALCPVSKAVEGLRRLTF
jgi:DNA-binding PadR family transcriptional regulator